MPVIGDASDEPNETFVVNLSNLTGSPGSILDAQGVATITDDDAPPLLSVNDTSVIEGNAGTTTATFTASLTAPGANAVTFNWATVVGSATAGVDYVAASGSRTIAAGSTSTTFDVNVNGDVLDEADETFGITLSAPGNATIGDGSGLGTITDDDPPPRPLGERRLGHGGGYRDRGCYVHRHALFRERQSGDRRLGDGR